jgi:hypothetical protein
VTPEAHGDVAWNAADMSHLLTKEQLELRNEEDRDERLDRYITREALGITLMPKSTYLSVNRR